MEAAAYAGLVSLMIVLIRYQHPTCPVSFDKLKMQTLLDRVSVLVEFLESYPQIRGGVVRKMSIAAHATKDVIESFYVNRILATEGLGLLLPCPDKFILCPDLEKATQELDLIIEEAAIKVKGKKPEETFSFGSHPRTDSVPVIKSNDESVCMKSRLAPRCNDKGLETAAAYKALDSLMNVLTEFQCPTCPAYLDKLQMETLSHKARSMIDILDSYSPTRFKLMRDVERSIISTAYATEYIIDSCYANHIFGRDRVDLYTSFLLCSDLQKAIPEMDLIIKEAMEIEDGSFLSRSIWDTSHESAIQGAGFKKPRLVPKHNHQEEQESILKDPLALTLSPLQVSHLPDINETADTNMSVCLGSSSPPRDKNIMVGFDDQFDRLMGRLTINKHILEIIPIVGMGGIGKTTLARNVYGCPYVMGRFDVRAWVTISQDYTTREIIAVLLRDIGVKEITLMTDEELGDQLHKGLWGRKYLITLDDVWSYHAWNEIRRFIPTNNNGSRILLTTRLSNVAASIGSCSPFEMDILNDAQSWELLSNTIFGKEDCPRELETHGKKMARNCKGLPLSIVVLGGFLKMSPKTLEFWASVVKKVISIINTRNDGRCMNIFSLSYTHLPVHLKPCFLYMATFKEDYKVLVSKLMQLWVSNGLIKPIKGRFLEEVALEYLKDLIDRNLIMVGKRGLIGKLKSCSVHDLAREFCLREAKNQGFLCLILKDRLDLVRRLESKRCLAYHRFHYDNYNCCFTSTSRDSSSVCICGGRTVKLITSKEWPYSISLLWNVETLIIDDALYLVIKFLQFEFWKLPNLRHLKLRRFTKLPDPTAAQITCALDSLRKVSGIENFNCTDEVFKIIPNLNDLSMSYNMDYGSEDLRKISHSFTNLARLRKLEKLRIYFFKTVFNKCFVSDPHNLTFSTNLRKLELYGSYIPWKYMTNIGALPNLLVLKLFDGAFCGNEWSSVEGEFQLLKVLLIKSCDLRIWRAESSHFPRLEQLILMDLHLEEIPSGVGEVPSLELINLETSAISIAISAKDILDQLQDEGNDDLVVKCLYRGNSEEERTTVKKMANDKFKVTFEAYFEDDEDYEED